MVARGDGSRAHRRRIVFCVEALAFLPTDLRQPLMAGLPGEPVYGMLPEAGLPKG